MNADIVEPVGWLYPDGTYTPHRENLEQWGWSPVYAADAIERLTRERDEAKEGDEAATAEFRHWHDLAIKEGERAEAAEAELAKAREALEPFAKLAAKIERDYPDYADHILLFFNLSHGDFRRARAALAPAETETVLDEVDEFRRQASARASFVAVLDPAKAPDCCDGPECQDNPGCRYGAGEPAALAPEGK